MRTTLLLVAASALLAAVPGLAQSGDAARTVDALTACRGIGEAAARLSCFDRAAERLAGARTSGDLLVVDRKQVVERKRRSFGLATSPGARFGGGAEDRATEVRELTTTVRRAAPASYGRYNMELASGSVWQNVDPLDGPPAAGTAIMLKQASFGGYRATIGRGRSVLVKRIR